MAFNIKDFFKKKKKLPLKDMTAEVGRQYQDWGVLGKGTYNPDDIGIDVYKYMFKTDATVKATYSLIKLATLSRKWKVTSLESSQDVVEFIKYNFEHVENRIAGSIAKTLTALIYGFSVTEIVWQLLKDGQYKGKIGLHKLKSLDPETISFVLDKHGNVEKVNQKMNTLDEGDIVELPLEKLIVYSENKEFGNHYGTSRLRAVYKNWFIKETIIKFWNIALERWGQPIVIGTVPTTDDLNKMIEILNGLQNKSSIAKTEGWEIAALETGIGRSAGGDYSKAIEYHNEQITKGMLLPSLMMSGGQGGGSYGLGQTHFDIFTLMVQNLENDVSGIVEKYLIRPLVEYNFGVQKSYPEFHFEPLTKQDLFNLARTFALLVKNGVIGADEQWMRDMMSVPRYDAAEAGPTTVGGSKPKQKGPLPPAQTEIRKIEGSQQIKTPKHVADGLTKKEPRG